jgi:hypothetical protein
LSLLAGAMVMVSGTAAAMAGPAMADQMRKSSLSDLAAGATTVADRLAERSGVGAPIGPAHNGTIPGMQLGQTGAGFDFNIDDPRMRHGWDPSHYGDDKPRHHIHRYPRNRHYNGYNRIYYGGYYSNPWSNNRYYWDPYPYGVDGRLVNGVQPGSMLSMPAPATPAAQMPPPEPETDLDAARRLAGSDAFGNAVERYRAYLNESPEDFAVMAELAVALAGANRLDDAAAMARLAYGKDPTLATRPIDRRLAVPSRELRRVVVRAVRFAHDRDSASAWLLVAVLMQAEGRDSVGLRMVERAAARGLPSDISDAMTASLR